MRDPVTVDQLDDLALTAWSSTCSTAGRSTRRPTSPSSGRPRQAEMGALCLARWRLRERLGHDPDQYDEFGRDHLERLLRRGPAGR